MGETNKSAPLEKPDSTSPRFQEDKALGVLQPAGRAAERDARRSGWPRTNAHGRTAPSAGAKRSRAGAAGGDGCGSLVTGGQKEQSAWARIQRKPSNLPGQNLTVPGLRASLGVFFFPAVKPNDRTTGC